MPPSEIEGEITFIQDNIDSMMAAASSDREEREKQVEGMVKVIGFKGGNRRFGGTFSEGKGITFSWKMARECYVAGLMGGTIHFASTAVECAINNDVRLRSYRDVHRKWQEKNGYEPDGWLTLTRATLAKAKCEKLPVTMLLNIDEKVEDKEGEIEFIERRNKIAHGDLGKYLVWWRLNLREENIWISQPDISPREALDQLKKCSAFLEVWVASKPTIIEFFKDSHPPMLNS